MQAPILYFIDKDGFLSSSRPAQQHPIKGTYMTDALGAVLTPLPEADLPEHHRWRLVQGAWVATPDHRGREGFLPDGTPHKVETWGALPEGWAVEKPVIPPTLEEARNTALAAIKQARDSRLENGGLVWQGYLVSVDKEATDRMTSTAVQFMAGALTEVRWKMSDGEYALLNQEAFFAMSMAAGTLVQQCYGEEEVKRQQVLKRPTAEAVIAWLENTANLRSGWPPDGAE